MLQGDKMMGSVFSAAMTWIVHDGWLAMLHAPPLARLPFPPDEILVVEETATGWCAIRLIRRLGFRAPRSQRMIEPRSCGYRRYGTAQPAVPFNGQVAVITGACGPSVPVPLWAQAPGGVVVAIRRRRHQQQLLTPRTPLQKGGVSEMTAGLLPPCGRS